MHRPIDINTSITNAAVIAPIIQTTTKSGIGIIRYSNYELPFTSLSKLVNDHTMIIVFLLL